MAENFQANPGAGGDVFAADDIGGIKYPRSKMSFGVDGAATDVSATDPLPVTGPLTDAQLRATDLPVRVDSYAYPISTNNSSTVQLASGASFTGTIETPQDQPSISLLLTSDQAIELTVRQYIDLAGTRAVPDIVHIVPARKGLSGSFAINGNYCNVIAKNIGAATTTTFNLNVAYGTLPSSNGTGLLPSTIIGTGDYAGVPLLESCIIGDLALSTQNINNERRDINGAQMPSDSPVVQRIVASTNGQQFLIDTQGYQTLTLTMGTMAAAVTGSNDTAAAFGAISCYPLVLGAPVTTATVGANFIVPCFTRFIKLTVSTVGWAFYTLRQTPMPVLYQANTPVNLGQIGAANVAVGTAQLGINLVNVSGAAQSSTNPLNVQPVSLATTNNQTLGQSIITATAAAVVQVKGSAGRLTMLNVSNNTANGGYLHLQNNATAANNTASVQTYAIPPSIGGSVSVNLPVGGMFFSAGIAFTVSGAIASADTTALTAPSMVVNYAFI